MKVDRFLLDSRDIISVVIFSGSDYHAPLRVMAPGLVDFTAKRKSVQCLISRDSFVYNVNLDNDTCSVVHYTVLFEKMQVIWHSHFKESIEASIEAYLQHRGLEFPQIQI